MSDPFQRLQSALDSLDAVFVPDAPFTVDGCTHCYTEEDFDVLSGPPHLVPDDLLAAAAMEVPSHWEDFPGLFRRLAHRIVRAAVHDELHVDTELLASRLLEADWKHWPAPQRAALTEVWHAWLRATVHQHPSPVPITDVMALLAVSSESLAPWLAIVDETRTAAADEHVRDLLEDWFVNRRITDFHLGFYHEYFATPELMAWFSALDRTRVSGSYLEETLFTPDFPSTWRPSETDAIDG